MENNRKKKLIHNKTFQNALFSFFISLVLLFILFFWHDNNTLLGWSNITFASGAIIIGFGLLIYVSAEGGFDYLAFSLKSFARLFKKNQKGETYLDYVEHKKRPTKSQYLGFIYGGLPMLFTSIILIIIFYSI